LYYILHNFICLIGIECNIMHIALTEIFNLSTKLIIPILPTNSNTIQMLSYEIIFINFFIPMFCSNSFK